MVFFLLSHFWTAQTGKSIRMLVFCAGSFLDWANGKNHKNGSFLSDGLFLDCAKGKELKNVEQYYLTGIYE